jgi:hypothetical protein
MLGQPAQPSACFLRWATEVHPIARAGGALFIEIRYDAHQDRPLAACRAKPPGGRRNDLPAAVRSRADPTVKLRRGSLEPFPTPGPDQNRWSPRHRRPRIELGLTHPLPSPQ